MPIPLGLVGAGISALSGLITSGKQKRLARKIKLNDPTYEESKYAKNNLALAQQLYNARMAGAAQQEQNILSGQSNAISAVQRNASSGTDALAAAAGIQGQTNQSFADLGLAEAQDKLQRYALVNQANQQMVAEGDKVYGDKLRKYQEALQAKNALQGAALQNFHNSIAGFGNALAMYGNSEDGGNFFNRQQQTNGLTGSMFIPTPGTPLGNVSQGTSPAAAFGNIPFRPLYR